jgi:hypothetical protein
VEGFQNKKELPIGEHVHLNRLDGLRFPMYDAPNSLGRVVAEHRFTTVEAHRRRNLFNSHGLAVDIEDFADEFLTALSFPAHMTAKQGYLRLV